MTTNQLTTAIDQALNWRYATKRFDSSKQISADIWSTLENSLLQSPSSFGLQPWRFVVVNNPALREELKAHSWNQPQIVEASHLVVIASACSIDTDYIDAFINRLATERSMPVESLSQYRQMIVGFVQNLTTRNEIESWTTRQSYIALGMLLSSAALLNVDTCPLEGISPPEYNKILGLEGSGYSARVACALGYRSSADATAQAKKVRYPHDQVFLYR